MRSGILGMLVLITSPFVSCSLYTTNDPKVDFRKLSWSIDTVYFQDSYQTLMTNIWGNSKDNIYLTGHCDDSRGKLFHFDGTVWATPTYLGINWGGPLTAPFDLGEIIGFSDDDIYIAAGYAYEDVSESLILHFDGSSWQVEDLPLGGKKLFSIWGNAPDNIWAGGNYNTILHFDGAEWTSKPVVGLKADSSKFVSRAVHTITGNEVGGYYMALYSVYDHGITSYHFCKLQNNQWTVIDTTSGSGRINDLWMSPEGTLYRAGGWGVFKWNSGNWILTHDLPSYALAGTSDDNIFVTSREYSVDMVFHFDGNDWEEIDVGMNDDISGAYDIEIISEQVYIVGYTTGITPAKSIVYRGK